MTFLWVGLGSAVGGVLRYGVARLMEPVSDSFPWGTITVNILGCFVIGWFAGGRPAVSESTRIFVMVGLCGGFTTFSTFSLQTLNLLREGAWTRASANVLVSVLVCLLAVALGHRLAQRDLDTGAEHPAARSGPIR